ncbi:hypothetical protein Taro_048067 [Colocasia esculenta]|uniref:Uncharacterized protein n=1 Tax=Colocasia esculenta TaxID=4460 RepID=A0A843X4R1_COLES|nr:hypothetical protein [Colocasia esculenta]
MVRGARSGSSSGRRSSRGRGLFAASASGSSSVPPSIAAGSDEFTPPPPRVPGSGQCTPSPPTVADMDKIEPAQASQFITRSIQAHFLGPIHRFNDFSMEVQELLYQMFMSNH